MNYKKIYDALMAKAKARGVAPAPSETHHVVPRCMGGSDNPDNLVSVTYREHLVAHLLLHRANPTNKELAKAFFFMCYGQSEFNGRLPHRVTSRMFDAAKRAVSGELNCNARLTTRQVTEIRRKHKAKTHTKTALADDYGVSYACVYQVVSNKTWVDQNYKAPKKRPWKARFTASEKIEMYLLWKEGTPYEILCKQFDVPLKELKKILAKEARLAM